MIFSSRESLEDAIVRLIGGGKTSALEIAEVLKEHHKKFTMQALYKALRYLVKDAVVLKTGPRLSLNKEWSNAVVSTLTSGPLLPQLRPGESILYSFRTLSQVDAYWKHLNIALNEELQDFPVFIYNPFGIWNHISERRKSQMEYLHSFAQERRYAYWVIGNNTRIDRELKREYQNDFLQINIWTTTPYSDTDFFTIIGEYIIAVKFNKELAKKMASVYKDTSDVQEIDKLLAGILQRPGRVALKLERNPAKANQLRKKLSKGFFIPQVIKNSYRLF